MQTRIQIVLLSVEIDLAPAPLHNLLKVLYWTVLLNTKAVDNFKKIRTN